MLGPRGCRHEGARRQVKPREQRAGSSGLRRSLEIVFGAFDEASDKPGHTPLVDHATFEEPHQYATGMVHVLVNGVPVLRDGEHTGATPGRVVRGPGWRGAAEAAAGS